MSGQNEMTESEHDVISSQFDYLIDLLRQCKPNDRSERDRYHAIVITEVEKAKAVYMQYAAPNEPAQVFMPSDLDYWRAETLLKYLRIIYEIPLEKDGDDLLRTATYMHTRRPEDLGPWMECADLFDRAIEDGVYRRPTELNELIKQKTSDE